MMANPVQVGSAGRRLLMCSDRFWQRFGDIAANHFERIPPERYGQHYARSEVNERSALYMRAVSTLVMLGFIQNPEAIRTVPENERPHAPRRPGRRYGQSVLHDFRVEPGGLRCFNDGSERDDADVRLPADPVAVSSHCIRLLATCSLPLVLTSIDCVCAAVPWLSIWCISAMEIPEVSTVS